MQIWLGKQRLGQKDKHELDNTSSDGSMSPKSTIEFVDTKAKDDED